MQTGSSAYKTLKPVFHDLILEDQDCFASEAGWQTLLQLLPREAQANLREKWENDSQRSSEEKWQDVEDETTDKSHKNIKSYYF